MKGRRTMEGKRIERLTHKRVNGIREGYWSPNKKQDLIDRLAAYENTGVDPEQIRDLKERDIAKTMDNSCTCDEKTHYKCPNCGEIIVTEYVDAYRFGRVTNFCEKCGQRLKREEDS